MSAFVAVVAPSAVVIIELIFMLSNRQTRTYTPTHQHTPHHSHPACTVPEGLLLLLSLPKPNNQRDMQIIQLSVHYFILSCYLFVLYFKRQQGISHSHIPTLLLSARFVAALTCSLLAHHQPVESEGVVAETNKIE